MKTELFATPHASNPALCTLPSGESISRERAKLRGFQISDAPAPHIASRIEATLSRRLVEADSYHTAIMGLPEAADRPKAAAKIASIHNATSLPLHRAKAMLASLPIEQKEKPMSNTRATIDAEKIITRRVEIRAAALAHRANLGDDSARSESRKLNYALSIKAQSPQTSIMTALQQSGADIEAIRGMRSA
jgi:hypothetical protein